MITLITNETCFTMKSVHIRQCIAQIMIETTSQGSFNYDQTEHVKNGGHAVRRRVPKSFKIGLSLSFYGTKCLFKIWANESIQQELSAMGRKQNIWQNIATNAYDGGYKRTKQT